MLLALTCALCTILPAQVPVPQAGATGSSAVPVTVPAAPAEQRTVDLSLSTPAVPQAPVTDPLSRLPQAPGSGDGDHSGHSDHMAPMWIMMGVMVAVMVVGMGVYASNHRGTAAAPPQGTAPSSPAALAVPVGTSAGGSWR
jgi:hypothetical protein